MRAALFQPDIPQNLGASIRLCACLGVELGVIEPCAFPLSDKALRRAALGCPKPGKRKAIIEQAQAGDLPAAPDFSKPTHARCRLRLAKLVALAEAGYVDGLKAIEINLFSTSPKAMARYRELVVVALEARRTAA